MNLIDIEKSIKIAKIRLLKMHYDSAVGHIGGNLSCLDTLIIIFNKFFLENDRFILSKGHSAGALYVSLWSIGILNDKDLLTFHGENTLLAGHPPPNKIPNIFFATGSLGHGLSLASGVSLAKKIKAEKGNVFCITSDGEWQEGSTWEALFFACQHNLNNLTILVDQNKLQGFGFVKDISPLSNLFEKLKQFDLDIEVIDGHSAKQIISSLGKQQSRCRVIILDTNKGNGISFMENKMEWHYLPLNNDQYLKAISEIESL